MPIPKRVARFNRKATNRITIPFARRLGGFGVVRHVGRRSGRTYETPINCWRRGGVVTVALTYGRDVDWLKNLEAAGGGSIVIQGETVPIGPPRMLDEETGRERMPAFVRPVLTALGVHEFVEFPAETGGGRGGSR